MSDIKLSENQKLAINTRNKNILVSAAAGAGKTFVLVQRVLKLITDRYNPVDIDTLLIVTFTQSAAAEMRSRIGKAINKELEKNRNNRNLIRQSLLLNKASICTMDAFCGNLVRNNFYKTDIDPGYRILTDSGEIDKLKLEVIDEIFNERYEHNDRDFIRLADAYCDKYNDDNLVTIILDIYNASINNPYPEKWLEMCRKNYSDTFYKTPVGIEIYKKIDFALTELKKSYNNIAAFSGPKAINNKVDAISALIEQFDNKPIEEITQVPKTTSLTEKQREKCSAEFCAGMDSALFYYEQIRSLIINIEETDFILKEQKPLADTLIDTVLDFSKRYKQKKLELKAAEFNDIQHYALEILRDSDGSPTDIAESLKEKYTEIIIDEYQDSSNIQEEIFTSFSRGNNMFMVGDIKQSIYKFREANPVLFKEKYNSYQHSENSVLVPLFENYRSKSCVIEFCNTIFSQLMRDEFGDVDYNAEGIALKSTDKEPEIYNKTDIYLLENISSETEMTEDILGITKTEYEANFIAEKVKNILAENPDIKPEDIAVISKDRKSVFYQLLKAFALRGIPASAENNSSLSDTLEVQTIISLLKIIDNPYNNIPVITILHSHIYNITDSELTKIRLSGTSSLFYKCVMEYIENNCNKLSDKLKIFVKDISKFRNFAFNNNITAILNYLYDETNYYTYVSILPNGKQRQANLLHLSEIAERYEKYSPKSLNLFIDYIENSNRDNEAVLSDSSISSVNITTMHSSKGLEYNIVIIGFLGNNLARTVKYPNPVIHPKLGFALKYIKNENCRLSTSLEGMIRYCINEESLSENLRVLYVALTRAKKKLILTGVCPPRKKIGDFTDIDVNNPVIYCNKNKYYISWIFACKISKNIAEKHFISFNPDLMGYKAHEEKSVNMLENLNKIENADVSESTYKNICQKLNYAYHNHKGQELPAKLSISEIKRMNFIEPDGSVNLYGDKIPDKIECKPPEFLLPKKSDISGARRGTIYHCVFEHLDFKSVNTREDIKSTVNKLIEDDVISKKDAAVINISKFEKFINSNLYKRLQKADNVYKETSFMMEMKGYEIFGDRYRDADSDIVIHGIIDLYFIEYDHIILVDYKTDYVNNHNINELIDKYKIQLDLYKRALEINTGLKVTESIIYSVYEDMEIKL